MIIVITGPTCLGKSETAVNVALKINAEIVNGDAFQSYKEFDIGVAKPSKELLKKVPHHLYSFVDPRHEYSIMEYQQVLREAIKKITSRGKNVIIVGGSGLYIRSALYDYSFKEESKVDMSKFESMNNQELHGFLEQIDKIEADKIHENNRKRVLRAIKIYYSQNTKKSDIIAKQKHKPIYDDVLFFVRDMDRAKLYERINLRVDQMVKDGLYEEFIRLYSKYGNVNAMQAIGYKEFIDIGNTNEDFEKAIDLIKQHTRNYAKRQMTFIRHQFPVIFYKKDDDIIEVINNEHLSR